MEQNQIEAGMQRVVPAGDIFHRSCYFDLSFDQEWWYRAFYSSNVWESYQMAIIIMGKKKWGGYERRRKKKVFLSLSFLYRLDFCFKGETI
jgi:hypothetical protein